MSILGHLLRVPDKGGVKQKNKHHETIFPLTKNKEVQFKEPHLALGIPKSRPWYGMDIFRNPPIKKNRSRVYQTTNQQTLLRGDLKMNLSCQWPLLLKGHFCYSKEDTFTCFNLSTHQRVTVLGWGGRGTKHSELLQGHSTVGTRIFCSMRVTKFIPVMYAF